MNKTKIIYFLSAFVLIIGCFALNESYSLFVQTETINNVDSIVPTLSYSLEENDLTVHSVVLKANSSELIKVKINNNGTSDIKYVLSLQEKVENVDLQLVKLDGNDVIGRLNSENSKYIWFKAVNTNGEDKEIYFSLIGTYYTLNIENEEILSKINIDRENLYSLTLADTIKINSINATIDKTMESSTIYVEDLALLDENNTRGLLLNAEDDYTELTSKNSYYFSGDVQDNYVNFANMCFRIVRIEGDESIKLVLEDIDNICEESNGNYSIPMNITKTVEKDGVVEEITETIYNGTYGYSVNENEQIVLKYLNDNKLSMVNVFKDFQSKFNDYLTYMKVDSWCLDNNLYEEIKIDDEVVYNPVLDLDSNYINWNKMYYGTYKNIKNNSVSLKCSAAKVNKFNEDTDMYVSTLTASEVILAGINESDYSGNYLMNSYSLENKNDDINYNGINFWTLSPSHFDGLRSYAYSVNSKGLLVGVDLLDETISFRPSIVLTSGIEVLKGNGSKENPYEIKSVD